MKRYLLLILSAGGLPAALLAQASHLDIMVPHRDDTDLTGPVKSVEFDVCKNVSDEHTKELREYDRTGNLLKSSEWDSEGERINTATNFYDENGCFERRLYIDYEDKSTNDWAVVLNPETRQIAMKNERTGSVAIRTYSPEKYLLHYRLVDRDRKQIRASRNKRDDNRRTEYTRFDEDNRAEYTYYFKWKENGFIEKERQRYRQEKAERLHTYDYLVIDDHGNWTQQLMVRYDIGGKEKEKIYERITVRKIEYFDSDEDLANTVAEPDADQESPSNEAETESESTTDE
jgi:hypothetical protein